jgi:hypothetical protein
MTYLLNADPEDLRLTSVADYTFITNRNVFSALTEAAAGTITGTVQEFGDLVAATGTGNVYRVRGADTDGFGSFYVKDNGTGDYIEVVDPTTHNTIDGSTMPHELVRAADGLSYTFKAATWNDRESGDETLNPAPEFIGRTINDLTLYRNRLAIVSDEQIILSQVSDVFNFFAAKATDSLDSDPIARAASTNAVNILRFATVFRKILFTTSARAQFELTSTASALKPDTAEMDQATTYSASLIAKPANMGDVLYFGSKSEASSVIYEYFFQDTTLSNTAADISRHVRTYLPNDLFQLHADPTSQTMFVLTTGEQNSLFIYRTFFDGNEKLQSAWGKYKFGATEADAFIHGFHIFSGFVVLIIERSDNNIYMEQFPIEREAVVTGMPFMPLVDQRDEILGVYSASTDLTTWTTVWNHANDAQVVLGASGVIPGRQLIVSYPTATTITAVGDHSAGPAYVGRDYTFTVELSKIYPRGEDNVPIVTGDLRLRGISILYEDTSYFRLQITPAGGRDAYSYPFEGKELGDAALEVDVAPVRTSGFFGEKKILSQADTVKIEIINDQPGPCVITAAQWRGFFNEVGRQG